MTFQRTKWTPSQGTPTAQPEMFDTLIQSSAVSLFHAYGVAAAPLQPVEMRFEDFGAHYPLAAIGFKAPGMDAALILSIPEGVATQLRLEGARQQNQRDVVRELANQTMGRIKNRLSQYQVTLQCGLPFCADRKNDLERLAPQRGSVLVYSLRTVYQSIVLAIKGSIDLSCLAYASTTRLNGEGDILIFDDAPTRAEGAQR